MSRGYLYCHFNIFYVLEDKRKFHKHRELQPQVPKDASAAVSSSSRMRRNPGWGRRRAGPSGGGHGRSGGPTLQSHGWVRLVHLGFFSSGYLFYYWLSSDPHLLQMEFLNILLSYPLPTSSFFTNPYFNINIYLPKPRSSFILANMVATRDMWLVKVKLIKMK